MPLHIPLASMPIRRSGKPSSRWSKRLSRRCSRRQSPGRWRRTRALLPRGTKPPKLKPSKGAIRTAAGFRFTRLELIVKMKSRKRKQKKESFPRDSKSRSKSKLGEGVAKQMLIVGETNF